MGLFDLVASGVKTANNAANGFIDGLTGASAAKKARAKREQKASADARKKAVARAESAERRLAESKADATVAKRQGSSISAINRELAQRSLSTARAAQFEARELREFASGIADDLKALGNSAASVEALGETDERLAKLADQMGEAIKASQEHSAGVDAAIAALNEEASDTTAHLDALTERLDGSNGQFMSLGGDLLPYLRMALSVLNRGEAPANEIGYMLYIASGPFLNGRVDGQTAEIIQTLLQIWAYWDADGVSGLFMSRGDVPPSNVTDVKKQLNAMRKQLQSVQSIVESVKKWQSDPNVKQLLASGNVAPPIP